MEAQAPDRAVTFRQEGPCPYFSDGRTSTVEFVFPREEEIGRFHVFLENGYRRVGRLFYRTVCGGCSACRPIRVEVSRFRMSRSQRRTFRANSDIRVEVKASTVNREKIRLYEKYVATKHGAAGQGDHGDPEEILLNLHYGYPGALEMDYYAEDVLVGVGVVDAATGCLSSNYFYYDTGVMPRRLGVFSILQEITLCMLLGRRHYYLGFCVEETSKMAYKEFFRPNQVLREGVWRDYRQA